MTGQDKVRQYNRIRRATLPKRHPAEVTSDRLGDHYGKYYDRLSGQELDALSLVRHALERIAEEDGSKS